MTSNNKCGACDCCKRLYTRSGVRYWRCKQYYCDLKNALVRNDDCCGAWRAREQRYDLSARRLDEVMDDVAFLLQK